MRTTHELFVETYNHKSVVELTFNDEYHNGTGYFDPLTSVELGLPVGTRFRMNTGEVNNRKIVGIVTPVGNVVFFERYTGGESGVVTLNLPRALAGLYETGSQKAEAFFQAVGCPEGYNPNIGQVLNRVVDVARKEYVGELEALRTEAIHKVVAERSDFPNPSLYREGKPITMADIGRPRQRPRMSQIHATAEIKDPDTVNMDEVLEKIGAELGRKGVTSYHTAEQVERLVKMLPAGEYNYRRASLALQVANLSEYETGTMLDSLSELSAEEIDELVTSTIHSARVDLL